MQIRPRELVGNGLHSANDAAGIDFGLTTEACQQSNHHVIHRIWDIIMNEIENYTAHVDWLGRFCHDDVTRAGSHWGTGKEFGPRAKVPLHRNLSRL